MKTLKKAKTIIEKWIPMFEQYNTPFGIDCAITLLKEQEPKQVIGIVEFAEGMKSGRCPSCSRSFVSLNADETRFCKSCGQEVKWNA